MAEMHEHVLDGCTPEPLMNYLKALGVLRLVSEQKDEQARGFWRDDVFVLQSILDREALILFLLEEYKPTPIVAPWGARSGFYQGPSEKAARNALQDICSSQNARFGPFRETVEFATSLLDDLGLEEKAKEENKLVLLNECRARFPDSILPWLDATYVLTTNDRLFPPLLGTGGNEGSGSYVSGFAQQIVACLIKREFDPALRTSLLSESTVGFYSDQTPGQFSPTSGGGPNAGQGFERGCLTNPWDYVLMIEGTLLFAGVVAKRLGVNQQGKAAFPFTVNSSTVGYGSAADNETSRNQSRGEMWLPLWDRPVSLHELKVLIGEGRAELGNRMARSGLDFTRAIACLGIDRGISSFTRYGFLKRNGLAFIATPLGRFKVREPKKAVDLLRELDPWLDRFRRAASPKESPPRFQAALRRIERAIFDFCQYGENSRFAEILCALGNAERELADGERFREKNYLRPISDLSKGWLRASNDGSIEFELALALAHVYDGDRKIGPLRSNLEPVTAYKKPTWAEKERRVVWNQADLAANLCAVLERRLMDGERNGCSYLPIAGIRTARLDAVANFIWGQVDDRRIEELLWGLILLNLPGKDLHLERGNLSESPPVPRSYALLKHLFYPWPLPTGESAEEIKIRPEPAVLPLLRADRVGEACTIAIRRLRASGLVPMPHSRSGEACRNTGWSETLFSQIDGVRLAAALLIPISSKSIKILSNIVFRQSLEEKTQLEEVRSDVD